jgi:hypothetical protein
MSSGRPEICRFGTVRTPNIGFAMAYVLEADVGCFDIRGVACEIRQ